MQLRNCASTNAAVSTPSRMRPRCTVRCSAQHASGIHCDHCSSRCIRCSTRYGSRAKIVPAINAGQHMPASGTGCRVPGARRVRPASAAARRFPSESRCPSPESSHSRPARPARRSRTSRYIARADSHGPSRRIALLTGRIGAPAASSGVARSPCSRTASENASTRVAGWKIGGSNSRAGCVVSASAIHDSRHMLNSVSWCAWPCVSQRAGCGHSTTNVNAANSRPAPSHSRSLEPLDRVVGTCTRAGYYLAHVEYASGVPAAVPRRSRGHRRVGDCSLSRRAQPAAAGSTAQAAAPATRQTSSASWIPRRRPGIPSTSTSSSNRWRRSG